MGKLGRSRSILSYLLLLPLCGALYAQEAPPAAKAALHVIGVLTAADPAAGTITVKADKTGQEYTFTLANTKTLLKVPPGSKDLKAATRITAADLEASDRVDVRYAPDDASASPIPARSVLLMSARDLEQARQAEQAAWQNSTTGTVTAVRLPDHALDVRIRSAEGPKVVTVQTTPATVFTRYSPDNPSMPAPSGMEDIQPGDQVRIIGALQDTTLAAQKIYSGGFRTIPATIVSLDPDNAGMTVADLQTKRTFHVAVTPSTMVRKLPPMVAMMIAHRSSGTPDAHGSAGTPAAGPSNGADGPSQWQRGQGAPPPGGDGARMGGGDPAKMLEHMPGVALTDLKPGDAVLLSVAKGKDPNQFVASAVIAGVEPIFQSSPAGRQGQSFGGGDWGLDMGVPAQ